MQNQVSAVIVAAGRGVRFGAPDKAFSNLAGRPMVSWSLDAFSRADSVAEIILVAGAHTLSAARDLHKSGQWPKLSSVLQGGERRQDSVRIGTQASSAVSRLVAIHDAARPLISEDAIDRCAGVAARTGAAILATPIADTLKKSKDQDTHPAVERTIPREDLWAAQTPQIFERGLLLTALERCETEKWEVTDDASMLERMGQQVTIVPGESTNFKITAPADAVLAESLIKRRRAEGSSQRSVIRSGIGYDVHRFATNRPLMLGGIEIPFEWGLEGHSDADVLLHAITDALLGAAALGDIGMHFPPGDPEWRDARSETFLRGAASLLADAGYSIVNVDATIVAEAPKILPYVQQIRERIAAVLAISPDAVSIKATTNEQMGFIGRQEGIAALATAIIEGTAR